MNADNKKKLLSISIFIMLTSLLVTVLTLNPVALGITVISAVTTIGISIYMAN
jgi:hypothetical protein